MDTSSALEPVCVYLPAQQQAGAHADMAAEFVVKLANNTKLINEMGENGFKRISEHYSMEVFSEEVEKILEQVQ